MVDEQLKAQVDAYVDEVWEDVVSDIRSLVRIESVEDLEAAEPGKPWGPASYEALAKGLEIAARLGLDAHDCEGYIGYADLPGASDTQIATIAHTDIVPCGTGWTVPALDVTRRDGYLLGRGVLDDKGPFVLSLYAAHYFVREVRRSGQPLPYTLRCLVGNDEETSMADVEWYLEHFEAPAFCFTPDADFPLICGEKGILHGLMTTNHPIVGAASPLARLDAGTVPNAIPGVATATLGPVGCELAAQTGLPDDLRLDEDGLLTARGIGGHAAFPESTDHAIGKLVRFLLAAGAYGTGGDQGPDQAPFLHLVERLTRTSDGSAVGLASSDEVFGALTLNAGVARTLDDGRMSITIDVRYPTSITSDELVATLQALAEQADCSFEAGNAKEPFYMDPSLPAIQTLLGTYNEYMGTDKEAFVIGGGTYARHFPRACAFGPHDPSVVDPDWVGIEHGPDEGVSEEVLRRALKVYIVSIARLMELDLG